MALVLTALLTLADPSFVVVGDAGSEVPDRCARLYAELAARWLDQADARPDAPVRIHRLDAAAPHALAWPADGPGVSHRLWLFGDGDGETLGHELTHLVLADAGLPLWLEEGIATQADGPAHRRIRRRELDRLLRQDRWLERLADADFSRGDPAAYALAASFVDFVLGHDALTPAALVGIGPHLHRPAALRGPLGYRSAAAFERAWRRHAGGAR